MQFKPTMSPPQANCQQRNVVVVTGASRGIGYETALALAKQPNTAVCVCSRDQASLDAAVTAITRAAHSSSRVCAVQMDLASLSSIHKAAQQLVNEHNQIRGLVLNAGVTNMVLKHSEDGVEATWATNHLGHFYLTNLLLPFMVPNGRIVATSSGTHDPANRHPLPAPKWDHPAELAMLRPQTAAKESPGVPAGRSLPQQYNGFAAYTNSKLCNILFAYELADKLKQQGRDITAVAYNPGFVPSTAIFRDLPGWANVLLARLVPGVMWLRGMQHLVNTGPAAGAFQAQLAVGPEFEGESHAYFNISWKARSSEASLDKAKAEQLWQYSEQLLQQLGAKPIN